MKTVSREVLKMVKPWSWVFGMSQPFLNIHPHIWRVFEGPALVEMNGSLKTVSSVQIRTPHISGLSLLLKPLEYEFPLQKNCVFFTKRFWTVLDCRSLGTGVSDRQWENQSTGEKTTQEGYKTVMCYQEGGGILFVANFHFPFLYLHRTHSIISPCRESAAYLKRKREL